LSTFHAVATDFDLPRLFCQDRDLVAVEIGPRHVDVIGLVPNMESDMIAGK
jgi:hypothetical protein